MKGSRVAALVAALCALSGALVARGSPAVSYTSDQAWHGRLVYYEHCAECHGGDLSGNFGPALAGPNGELQWLSGQYVYGYITSMMPHGNPGALSTKEYVDVMAFLYQQHKKSAGTQPLTASAAQADTAPMGGE